MPIPRAHEHHCPAPGCPNGVLYCLCNYEYEPDWCEDHREEEEEQRQEAIRADIEAECQWMADAGIYRQPRPRFCVHEACNEWGSHLCRGIPQ